MSAPSGDLDWSPIIRALRPRSRTARAGERSSGRFRIGATDAQIETEALEVAARRSTGMRRAGERRSSGSRLATSRRWRRRRSVHLPPISGGAPDSSVPEAEIDTSQAGRRGRRSRNRPRSQPMSHLPSHSEPRPRNRRSADRARSRCGSTPDASRPSSSPAAAEIGDHGPASAPIGDRLRR